VELQGNLGFPVPSHCWGELKPRACCRKNLRTSERVALLPFIMEIPNSNLGLETSHTELLYGFPHLLQQMPEFCFELGNGGGSPPPPPPPPPFIFFPPLTFFFNNGMGGGPPPPPPTSFKIHIHQSSYNPTVAI